MPTPNPPYLISKGSTWVQIGWDPLDCDGGHGVNSYDVEYQTGFSYFYRYVTAGRVSGANNYTIHGLVPNTEYNIRTRAISSTTSRTSTSTSIAVTTSLQGTYMYTGMYNIIMCKSSV